jgi:hypothetical protein
MIFSYYNKGIRILSSSVDRVKNGNNHKNDDNRTRSAAELLAALAKLESVIGGEAVVDTIVISLKEHNIDLEDDSKSYSLDELQKGLEKIIGEGSVLLIERLRKELQ